jgi:hypothetical protein
MRSELTVLIRTRFRVAGGLRHLSAMIFLICSPSGLGTKKSGYKNIPGVEGGTILPSGSDERDAGGRP